MGPQKSLASTSVLFLLLILPPQDLTSLITVQDNAEYAAVHLTVSSQERCRML